MSAFSWMQPPPDGFIVHHEQSMPPLGSGCILYYFYICITYMHRQTESPHGLFSVTPICLNVCASPGVRNRLMFYARIGVALCVGSIPPCHLSENISGARLREEHAPNGTTMSRQVCTLPSILQCTWLNLSSVNTLSLMMLQSTYTAPTNYFDSVRSSHMSDETDRARWEKSQ